MLRKSNKDDKFPLLRLNAPVENNIYGMCILKLKDLIML